MKRHSRTLISRLLLLSIIGLNAIPANAWGAAGHRIVAGVAQNHLTPHAKQQIAAILGPNVTLDSVATFADDIRNSRPDTRQFHFVDIEKDLTDYVPSRDCPQTAQGDCVIAALERFRQQVFDPHASLATKQFALKFIIHLVGDMHQPLHCSDNHDHGGNGLSVQFFNQAMNLHSLWDSGIIAKTGLSESQYASALEGGLTPQQISQIQQGTTIQWALESHALAKTNAYDNVQPNASLGQAYFNTNKPIVDMQLRRGGLRLAKVLNDLFP
jgi:hypothetical protein